MLVNTNLALAIRCNMCGKTNINQLSLFNLERSIYHNIECPCGEIKARIKTKDYREYRLEIPCFACQETHVFKYSLDQLLKGNLVIRCIEGLEICFLGNDSDVKEILKKEKNDLNRVLNELNFYDYFINFDVMIQCINKIKKLEQENSIICECSKNSISMDLFPDRVELKCLDCNGIQIIYAENKEDLENILKKEYIFIHQDRIEYIDALNLNNDRNNN